MVTHGGMETTLTVSGFNKEDVGQYQCIATNQYGEAQQSIFVDIGSAILFIPMFMVFSQFFLIQYLWFYHKIGSIEFLYYSF